MNEAERIIAILVDRLGGDVEISDAELTNTDLGLTVDKSPSAFVYMLRTHSDGEVVDHHPTQAELDAIVHNHNAALKGAYPALWAAVQPRPVEPRERVVSCDEIEG